jgi:exopolyphosphatase/guanosine-5'-triphosphate,3'-diphosphate pyrophosphatase
MAVATAAVREAKNRHQLLDKLRREGGVEVQVLSGEEEGRLSALAAIRSLSFRNGAVADLGGGSLQLSHVRNGEVGMVASLPLGAVRTTQMFFANDPPSPQALSSLRKEVQRWYPSVLPQAKKGNDLVGLGGTIRTLARMHLAERQIQRSRQGFRLERAVITALRERMERLSTPARSRLPGLKAERADIMLAGAIVIEEALRLGNYPAITVCIDGVRHGLLLRETFNGGS